MHFKPNELEIKDIENLEGWQLLVSACHFADKMTDCVSLDYEYRIDGKGHIRIVNMRDIDITDDIDIKNPVESLERYAEFDWKEWCKLKIKKWIEDNK